MVAMTKGKAKLIIGFAFIAAGFVIAAEVPVLNVTTNTIRLNIFLGFAISFSASGLVLAANGAIDEIFDLNVSTRPLVREGKASKEKRQPNLDEFLIALLLSVIVAFVDALLDS